MTAVQSWTSGAGDGKARAVGSVQKKRAFRGPRGTLSLRCPPLPPRRRRSRPRCVHFRCAGSWRWTAGSRTRAISKSCPTSSSVGNGEMMSNKARTGIVLLVVDKTQHPVFI